MKQADSFYKSRRWERLRSVILRRDGYQCQISRRYGKHIQADTVHHIFPREEYPEYQWEAWNLVSLAGDVHNRMHDRNTNALTEEGTELLRRTAKKYNKEIPPRYNNAPHGKTIMENKRSERILVCGYPGTGKTTWVREHLGDGIVYDLDAIAGAFRLKGPHEENHEPSRRMANDLLYGFIRSAGEYSDKVFIIRTAPPLEELEDIAPSRVVVRLKRYVHRPESPSARQRLQQVVEWCEDSSVPVEVVGQ